MNLIYTTYTKGYFVANAGSPIWLCVPEVIKNTTMPTQLEHNGIKVNVYPESCASDINEKFAYKQAYETLKGK